jgi:hypothetical protein
MIENERKGPGEAAGDGRAQHGYQNEVNWEGGKGQPYANQGSEEQGPAAARETEAGNRGEASGRNLEQLEQLKKKPDRPTSEAPREDGSGEGGVS